MCALNHSNDDLSQNATCAWQVWKSSYVASLSIYWAFARETFEIHRVKPPQGRVCRKCVDKRVGWAFIKIQKNCSVLPSLTITAWVCSSFGIHISLCVCVCVCVSWLSVFFSPPPCALLCRIKDVFVRVARRQWEPVHRLAESDNNLEMGESIWEFEKEHLVVE